MLGKRIVRSTPKRGRRATVGSMTRGRLRTAALAGAAALVFAACGSDGTTADPPVETPEPVEADNAPLQESGDDTVPELLRFTAPLVGGGEIDAAATAGTPTAFWFWSPT